MYAGDEYSKMLTINIVNYSEVKNIIPVNINQYIPRA